jgi:hypothetical protein
MVHRRSLARAGSAALVVISAFALSAERRPVHPGRPIHAAFYQNNELQVQPVIEPGQRNFTYGPWTVGSLVHDDKVSDRRFNLYIIVPGNMNQPEKLSVDGLLISG